MNNENNNKSSKNKVFLCSFCGIFIQVNLNNLRRHEKLHESPSALKIKCVAENCMATFQQKSDYYRHWNSKHKELMPDGLNYINEERKVHRRKCRTTTNDANSTTFSQPNDFLILNYLGLIQKTAANIKLPIPHCGPFFGKLEINQSI